MTGELAASPGREHARIDGKEAPGVAGSCELIAGAGKPMEHAGCARSHPVGLQDVEHRARRAHRMQAEHAVRDVRLGAGFNDVRECGDLRRFGSTSGGGEVEPHLAYEPSAAAELGGASRDAASVLVRLDPPGMEAACPSDVARPGRAAGPLVCAGGDAHVEKCYPELIRLVRDGCAGRGGRQVAMHVVQAVHRVPLRVSGWLCGPG